MIAALLIAALAGAGCLLAAEVGCRWWVRRRSRYYVWPPRLRAEIRLARDVFPDAEPRVRFEINTEGERGSEVPRDRTGLYRVLAAGGSAVECFALDQATSWPGALERLLSTPQALRTLRSRRVHVGNIGHSGVGAAELDRILERVLSQYPRLDLILIMVGASDVYHWIEEGASPSRPPSPVAELRLFAQHPRQRFGWTRGTAALAEIAGRLRRSLLRRPEVKSDAGAWYAPARRMRAQASEIRATLPDAAVMVKHFEDQFRSVCRRAMEHADRVVVMLQPWFEGEYTPEEAARFWHGGIGRPWKETVNVYYSLDVVNQLLDLVHARAALVADELGVQRLNLRNVLTQRARHYFDHDHYTPAGAAIVAQAVAGAVLAGPEETRVGPGERPAVATAGSTE